MLYAVQWRHWLGIETKLARFSKVFWRRSKMIIPSLLLRLVITSWLARLFPAFSFIRHTDGTIRLSPQPEPAQPNSLVDWRKGGLLQLSLAWLNCVMKSNQITVSFKGHSEKKYFLLILSGLKKFVIYSQYTFYRSAHPAARPAERSFLSFDELKQIRLKQLGCTRLLHCIR